MPRILVIDDEPRIVSFVSRVLTAEGFGVDTATDAAQALRLARAGGYDLIVLDLMLGGRIGGIQILEQTLAAHPGQRFLVLSALDDVASKVRCLELGASDYLTKPFALDELLARVRARVRESAPEREASTVLSAGGVTLDLKRREADPGTGPVKLSTREALLLESLMRKGDICTREELLEGVWGYSFDPGTNVVDVYVGRLRAKLGAETITTVRNVGYGFRST